MRVLAHALGLAMLLAGSGLAHAQATRTWVSGVGDDVNPCSRTAPCKTFAGAISKTAANGEINCLDPGGFGAVTITKSIAIVCDNTLGGVLGSGTNGIIVNDSGTATPGTIVVYLSGLDIQGAGTGINGVNFISGAALHVRNSTIKGFTSLGGAGLRVAPSSGTVSVDVSQSTIRDNANTTDGYALLIAPTGTASVNTVVDRVHAINNGAGIRTDGQATSGVLATNIRDSVVSNNIRGGITSFSAGATVRTVVERGTVTGNAGGIGANGANAAVYLTQTAVTGNATGLVTVGGTIFSFGDNSIFANQPLTGGDCSTLHTDRY